MGGEERRLLPSCFQKRYARSRTGARPARRSQTGAARLRMGGEEESAQTGNSNPGGNCLVRGYSSSMHFFWGGDMPHYSPPLPFRRGPAGCPCMLARPRGRPAQGWRTCALAGVPRPAPRVVAPYVRDGQQAPPCPARGSRSCALAGVPRPSPWGCGCVRARWPASSRPCPARVSRTGAAQLRMGGEEESARTGDSNPGFNYLVRGYCPSMHFFWGGDMPHYFPPLPFQRGRAGYPCVLASQPAPAPGLGVADLRAGWRAQARARVSCQSVLPF